jgi:hypothetical protein
LAEQSGVEGERAGDEGVPCGLDGSLEHAPVTGADNLS